MFGVSEAEAAAIRAAFDQGGEFAAAVELRRLFPGITGTAEARECARTIAAWKPLQVRQDGRVARPEVGKGRFLRQQPIAAYPSFRSIRHPGCRSSTSPSLRIASGGRCTGGWHVQHRQPFGWSRSVHQRVPWQARHHAPSGGGRMSVVLGICARLGGGCSWASRLGS